MRGRLSIGGIANKSDSQPGFGVLVWGSILTGFYRVFNISGVQHFSSIEVCLDTKNESRLSGLAEGMNEKLIWLTGLPNQGMSPPRRTVGINVMGEYRDCPHSLITF